MRDPTIRHVYDPVGHCIYCRATNPRARLSTEHVMPEGLGGRLELPLSSCETCRELTCRFEGKVLQGIFQPVRTKLGLLSKKRKRRHPQTIPENIYDEGSHTQEVQTPIPEFPALLVAFRFDIPGAMLGSSENGDLKGRIAIGPPLNDEAARLLARRGGRGVGFTLKANFDQHGQMLAKIAHAYCVAEKRLEGFHQTLPPIILDNSVPQSRYIGGDYDAPPPGQFLHEIGFIDNSWMLIVRMRLFSRFRGPVYYVVAGLRGRP